jgi:PhzF family phenazine biosynthesis protein
MVEIGHWLVFPRAGTTGGNPCPLVTDAGGLAPSQMLAIAAHYGHESAFVTSADASGADLRFFVPRHEMRMCVHATVAAVTALVSAGILGRRQATVRTASGEYAVSWGTGEPPAVTVEQNPPVLGPAAAVHRELAAALRLPEASMAMPSPVQPVSVSRAKLIVPVRDAGAVHRARPDYPALWALCQRLGTTGAYVFAPHADGDPAHLVARQFPVDAGYPEDPATGVAGTALAAYLAQDSRPPQPTWRRFTIDQGDVMGRPSTLRAAALAGPAGISRTSVTGRAVLTGRDSFSLPALGEGAGLPEPELR